ncbi:MAG: DsbA family protein [Gemmatimonadota bacterium]|nr:DsbA family protein [Gemmatimonadota bacterium]
MTPPVTAWLYGDVACPWSWLAHARLRALEDDGALVTRWRPLRRARGAAPEVDAPPPDRELAELGLACRFPSIEWASDEALCAVEFARDLGPGRERRALEALFRAGLGEGRDLGRRQVLLAACADAGLDAEGLAGALDDDRYGEELEIAEREADGYGIGAVPGVLVGRELLIGAAPAEVLAAAAARAARPG